MERRLFSKGGSAAGRWHGALPEEEDELWQDVDLSSLQGSIRGGEMAVTVAATVRAERAAAVGNPYFWGYFMVDPARGIGYLSGDSPAQTTAWTRHRRTWDLPPQTSLIKLILSRNSIRGERARNAALFDEVELIVHRR